MADSKTIPDYVHKHFAKHDGPVRRALFTKRGGGLSVQASRGHYCSPREDGAERYSTVEVWWSGRTPRSLRAYCGDAYGPASFVPVDVVNRLIRYRGGLA